MVGFSGLADDKVGPGDYDPESGHKLLKRTSTSGVTAWRKPQEPPATIRTILDAKKRMPGPGQYDVKSAAAFKPLEDMAKMGVRGTSSFQSTTQRAATAKSDARLRVGSKLGSRIGGGFMKGLESRPGTHHAMSRTQTSHNVDIFEDDCDGDGPAPGQYIDPSVHTDFKAIQKDPALQRFGSGVERFADPFESKLAKERSNVGPGSYNLVGPKLQSRSLHQLVYSGFSSSQQRF